MNPKYPVYVISKGRWETRLTSKELDRIGVPYKIVVEPQEAAQYLAEVPEEKILVGDEDFSKQKAGSIPVRNFVWEHSLSIGAERHWIMDDNISAFWRLNNNLRIRVGDGTIFRCAEDFTDRYENVAISGLQYYMFCPDRMCWPAFVTNTRVYSCILIRNDIPYRWRGRYNEDTDLSIRALKDGWCTILFNAFLAQKATTGTIKGGNMEHLYGGNDQIGEKGKEWIEKRRLMAQSLVDQHPDICKVTEKWGRPQHQVDYSQFKKNKLVRKPGLELTEAVNNYGMRLVQIKEERQEKSAGAVAPKRPKTKKEGAPPKPQKDFDQDYWAKQGFKRDPLCDVQTNLGDKLI